MAEGVEAVKNFAVLHAENQTLKRDLARADSLILVYRKNQSDQIDYIVDLNKGKARKDSIITEYKAIIKKVGARKKTWAISLQAGYGYYFGSEVKRAPYVGAGISKALIRF